MKDASRRTSRGKRSTSSTSTGFGTRTHYRWILCRGMAVCNVGSRLRIAGSVTDVTDHLVDRERLRTVASDPLTGCAPHDFLEVLGHRLDEYKRRKHGRALRGSLPGSRSLQGDQRQSVISRDELLIPSRAPRVVPARARFPRTAWRRRVRDPADNGRRRVAGQAIALRIQDALREPLSSAPRRLHVREHRDCVRHRDYTRPHEIMPRRRHRDVSRGRRTARRATSCSTPTCTRGPRPARSRERPAHAINNNDFEVHYQPISCSSPRMCVGFESLVR